MVKVRIGCRAFSKMELLGLVSKLKGFTTHHDRKQVQRKLMPVALMFSEFYFYLVAYYCDAEKWIPLYYRVDRIVRVVEHREYFRLDKGYDFNEGELRSRIQFMHSGEYRAGDASTQFEGYYEERWQGLWGKLPIGKGKSLG